MLCQGLNMPLLKMDAVMEHGDSLVAAKAESEDLEEGKSESRDCKSDAVMAGCHKQRWDECLLLQASKSWVSSSWGAPESCSFIRAFCTWLSFVRKTSSFFDF